MEYTLEMGLDAAAPRPRSALVARAVNLMALLVLLIWSWKWVPPMVSGVRSQTELGQNGLTYVPSAHQVFEVVFVAAHWGVRWLPGVALLGLVSYFARRMERRAYS